MAVLVSQATGCIITTGETEEDALITANWNLKSQASGQLGLPCPPNITTAAVYSQAVTVENQPVGAPIIDLFDCDDNTGTTAPLPPDAYQVFVELTSEGGATKYAKSTTWPAGFTHFDGVERADIVDVTVRDGTFSTTIVTDGGYFEFDWRLVDRQAGNSPISCAAAVADGVGVLSTSVSDPRNFFDYESKCEELYAITPALLQGAYTVEIEAIDAAGASLGDNPVLTNRTISDANKITYLGSLDIPID